jgi:deoxycytidine triphosphate deaminase
MSVVPLILEGGSPSVVERQDDFDVDGLAVLIGQLDAAQLKEGRASNVSYDLRIGRKYRDHRESDPKEIPPGGIVTLNPGSAIIIETEEYVHLPRRLFGIIAPKVSLLENGLSTTFSKVDPGYNGHLLITLFNLGQKVRQLKRGSTFCAFTLLTVADGARLYEKGPQQISARPASQPRASLRELLDTYHVGVMVALIVATLLLLLEHLGTFLWSVFHHANAASG